MSDVFETSSTQIETIYGASKLHVFSFGRNEQDNILCIETEGPSKKSRPKIRVQSACYTGEIFRSTDCDCHEQLDKSLKSIHRHGGYFIYMLADGRGAGLLTKIRGLALGISDGLDTFDAYERLGIVPDPRNYDRVIQVARALGIQHGELLTNNPRKLDAFTRAGIELERVSLDIAPTSASISYLQTKRAKFGHLIKEVSVDPSPTDK